MESGAGTAGAAAAAVGACAGNLGEVDRLDVVIVDDVHRVGTAVKAEFPKFDSLIEALATIALGTNLDRASCRHREAIFSSDACRIAIQVRHESVEIVGAPSCSEQLRVTGDEILTLPFIKFGHLALLYPA